LAQSLLQVLLPAAAEGEAMMEQLLNSRRGIQGMLK
jgi:hypothetical protein